MTIEAALRRLHLQSPRPESLAQFYSRAYGLEVSRAGSVVGCAGPGREVYISPGTANQLHHALYTFNAPSRWQAFCDRVSDLRQIDAASSPDLPRGAVSVIDPDGHRMVFALAEDPVISPSPGRLPAAMNQHFALRTTRIEEMLAFYRDRLGFVVSDRVLDPEGRLRACFLRTDALHHSLALFGAAITCFDHQSFETPSWNDLKDWADHMARERIEIVWGVGRHGPGNDAFFMVRDPDGNLAEISAEIETCAVDRMPGVWPHEERTLNLWGKAILRS